MGHKRDACARCFNSATTEKLMKYCWSLSPNLYLRLILISVVFSKMIKRFFITGHKRHA